MKIFDFEHTPIVDVVNDILLNAVKKGASDIHFDPKEQFLQIRLRVDGILSNYSTVKKEYVKNLITRIKIMAGMNITESRLPQDGAIKGRIKDTGRYVRFVETLLRLCELCERTAKVNKNK